MPDENDGYPFPNDKIPYMRIQFNDAADPDNDALGAKPMRSWQMLGAEVMDEYPREIELVLRNADDDELYCRTFLCEDADIKINLLDGENEEGLVKTKAEIKDGYIQGVKAVETYIKSWNKPGRMVKLFYCFDNMTERYAVDVLKDVLIVHEKVNASEVKFGLSSDICSVTILNSGRKFDRGYLKDQMQIRKRLIPYIDSRPQGAFYVKEWDISQDDLFIKCRANDRLLDYQNIEYEKLPAFMGEIITAYDLFDEILNYAAHYFVKSLSIKIDERLQGVKIVFPYIKRTKVWNALQSLCESTLSHINIDLDEQIIVKSDLLEFEENYEDSNKPDPHAKSGIALFRYDVALDTGNAFGINIPFFADMAVSKIDVKYYTPAVKRNEKLLTIEDVDAVTGNTITFKLGDLDFWAKSEFEQEEESNIGDIRFLTKDNDGQEVPVPVSVTRYKLGDREYRLELNEPFTGKIEIYGYKVELAESVYTDKIAEMTDRAAELNAYIHPSSDLLRGNATGGLNIEVKEYAQRIAQYMLAAFGAKTKCAVSNWRGDPGVLPERQFNLTDRFGDSAVFECSYNKTVLDGGLKQDTKGIWKFDCKSLQ